MDCVHFVANTRDSVLCLWNEEYFTTATEVYGSPRGILVAFMIIVFDESNTMSYSSGCM